MATLALKSLYEDEVVQIRLDKNAAVLELTFLQHPDTAHFRNGYHLAFDAALNKEIIYWLTDATHIKAMERENQTWLLERMTPLLQTGRIKKFAIVMAPECFVMTNPNQVYEKQPNRSETPSSGAIKVHFDKEAAYQWLFSGKEISVV